MDDPAQVRAYAEADFAAVNQGLVDRFCDTFPELTRGLLLDLGCGPGDVPLRLARALPDLHVIGLDAAATMLDLGRTALRAAGLAPRVSLVQAHLPQVPLAPASADAVFSNSLLHHLRDPGDLWRAIRACARPGAPILVCDLFRPGSEAEAQAIVDAADCSTDPILRHDFFHSLLAAYTLDEVRAQLRAEGLHILEEGQISERHLLVWGSAP